MEKVYIIESKYKGGGSYSTVCVKKTYQNAQAYLENKVKKYGDKDSYIDKDKIAVNIMGLVYFQIKEYEIEEE